MADDVYRRPTWVRLRLVNPVLRTLVLRARLGRRGEQNLMRVLRVRGRRSGREYDVPLRIAAWQGERYVVSLVGEAEWVRNLRAAGAAQLLLGASTEPVVAHEVGGAEKAAFLAWYCRQPEHRLSVRAGLTVRSARPAAAELERVAREHPVFRFAPATG